MPRPAEKVEVSYIYMMSTKNKNTAAAAKTADANGFVCEIKINILVRILGPDVRTSESRSNNSIGSGEEERYEEFSIDMIPQNLRPANTSNRNRFPLFSYQIAFDYTLLLSKSPRDIVETFFDRRKFMDFLQRSDTPKNASANKLPHPQIYHNNLNILLDFIFRSERSISSLSKQVYTKKERARYGLRTKHSKTQLHNLYSPRVFSPPPISNLLYQNKNRTIYRVQMLDTLELNLIYAEFIHFMNRFSAFCHTMNTINAYNTKHTDDEDYKKKIESILGETDKIMITVKGTLDTLNGVVKVATGPMPIPSSFSSHSRDLQIIMDSHRLLTTNIASIRNELLNFQAAESRKEINALLLQISQNLKALPERVAIGDRHQLLDDFLKGYGIERKYTKFIEEFNREVLLNCNPLYKIISNDNISSEDSEELNYIMTKLRYFDDYYDEYYLSLSKKFLQKFQQIMMTGLQNASPQMVDIKPMLGAIFTSFFLRKIKKKDDLNQWKNKAVINNKYSVYECIVYVRIFVFNEEIDLKTYTSRKFQCKLNMMNLQERETQIQSGVSRFLHYFFPPPVKPARWAGGGGRNKKSRRLNLCRRHSSSKSDGTKRIRW